MTEGHELGRLQVNGHAQPEVLDEVHTELEQLWETTSEVSMRDRMRFEMGLMEIVGNVVEHAYRLDQGSAARVLSVSVTVTDTEVRGVLADNGLPVEVDLGDVTLPDPEAESGRGLAMALASLDHLEHARIAGCNRWTLVCERSAP